MENNKISLYLLGVPIFILLVGFTIYYGAREKILLYAYKHGNAGIIPAVITVGQKSQGYDFSLNGKNYSNSLTTSGRTDIFIDSMDILYLKDHPWYNMPACDLISDCPKCLPYSEDNNRDLLRKEGIKIRVKPYIDQDDRAYAYKFSYNNCTYHGTLNHFDVNPNPEFIKDSVAIVFWPNNPNLNYGAYLLLEK